MNLVMLNVYSIHKVMFFVNFHFNTRKNHIIYVFNVLFILICILKEHCHVAFSKDLQACTGVRKRSGKTYNE